MYRLPRKCDYRTDRQTDGQTDTGQSYPYVLLQYASQATQKDLVKVHVSFRMHFVLRESFGLILCYVH